MPRTIKILVALTVVSVMLAAPRTTYACSACIGRSDSTATQGLNAAVITLLAALALVLGSVVGFLSYLIRRSIKHPLAMPSPTGGVAQ